VFFLHQQTSRQQAQKMRLRKNTPFSREKPKKPTTNSNKQQKTKGCLKDATGVGSVVAAASSTD
jgi:hypothetical protein